MFLTVMPVKDGDKVLEIGSGSSPHFQSTILVDKFLADSSHRWGANLYRDSRPLIEADAARLPFQNKSFDFVICRHVLEHADNPKEFLVEMERVGKAGYIETPCVFSELFTGYHMHSQILIDINGELRIKKKNIDTWLTDERLNESLLRDYNFQQFYMKNFENIFLVKHFWKDRIQYRICGENEPLIRYDLPSDLEAVLQKIKRRQTIIGRGLLFFHRTLYRIRGKIEWEIQKYRVKARHKK